MKQHGIFFVRQIEQGVLFHIDDLLTLQEYNNALRSEAKSHGRHQSQTIHGSTYCFIRLPNSSLLPFLAVGQGCATEALVVNIGICLVVHHVHSGRYLTTELVVADIEV